MYPKSLVLRSRREEYRPALPADESIYYYYYFTKIIIIKIITYLNGCTNRSFYIFTLRLGSVKDFNGINTTRNRIQGSIVKVFLFINQSINQ